MCRFVCLLLIKKAEYMVLVSTTNRMVDSRHCFFSSTVVVCCLPLFAELFNRFEKSV